MKKIFTTMILILNLSLAAFFCTNIAYADDLKKTNPTASRDEPTCGTDW